MDTNEISFENLPKAVAHLVSEMAEIKSLFKKQQTPVVPQKRVPIGIEETCRIIGKAKPTIYTLVRKRLLPCYKNGKKLYFFEDELLEWIKSGRKKTVHELTAELEANIHTTYGNRRRR
jgi:excisionase family DNA binding protein